MSKEQDGTNVRHTQFAVINHIRKVMRGRWTDGHRVYFSVEANSAEIEMPSVDLKVFLRRLGNSFVVFHTYADLDYIAGYWR